MSHVASTIVAGTIAFGLVSSASAQTGSNPPISRMFHFDQFPAQAIHSGPIVDPDLATSPYERPFAWHMERAQDREGVNFAGTYTIATWPCRSMCVSVVAIDAGNGRIVRAPEAYNGLAFRADSRLLIINPPRNLPAGWAANDDAYPAEWRPEYYEFTGTEFRRLDYPAVNTAGTYHPGDPIPPPVLMPDADNAFGALTSWGSGAYGSALGEVRDTGRPGGESVWHWPLAPGVPPTPN